MYFFTYFPFALSALWLVLSRHEHYVSFWEKKRLVIRRLTPWEKCSLCLVSGSSPAQMVHHRGKKNCLGQTKISKKYGKRKFYNKIRAIYLIPVYGLVFSFVFVVIFHDNWHVEGRTAAWWWAKSWTIKLVKFKQCSRIITCIHDLTK